VKLNVCSIWPFAQISHDFYYLDIWQCARYFVAALFKELALITIREMWGLESRSRTSRSRSGLGFYDKVSVSSRNSKFEPGLGLGGYGLDYITASQAMTQQMHRLVFPLQMALHPPMWLTKKPWPN